MPFSMHVVEGSWKDDENEIIKIRRRSEERRRGGWRKEGTNEGWKNEITKRKVKFVDTTFMKMIWKYKTLIKLFIMTHTYNRIYFHIEYVYLRNERTYRSMYPTTIPLPYVCLDIVLHSEQLSDRTAPYPSTQLIHIYIYMIMICSLILK